MPLPSSLVNRFCKKDTVRSGNSERPNFICPGVLGINHKSAQTSQSLLPVPCKRSSAAPIPFGFRLSVARPRRFALPVTARSASCGFVPLRQSRRNTVLRTPSYWGCAFCARFMFRSNGKFVRGLINLRFLGTEDKNIRSLEQSENKSSRDFPCAGRRKSESSGIC